SSRSGGRGHAHVPPRVARRPGPVFRTASEVEAPGGLAPLRPSYAHPGVSSVPQPGQPSNSWTGRGSVSHRTTLRLAFPRVRVGFRAGIQPGLGGSAWEERGDQGNRVDGSTSGVGRPITPGVAK